MTEQRTSSTGAVVGLVFALVLGVLTVLMLRTPDVAPRASREADVVAAGSSVAPALRLAAHPVSPRSQTEAPEPTTSTPVLPARCLDGDDTLPLRPGPCVITSFGADRPTVVVWGDSHAWQQVPALQAQAERTRTNLVAFLMGACPPMDLRGSDYRGLCIQQGEQALEFVSTELRQGRRVKVVLGGFWELYRDYHARAQAGWAPMDPHEQFLIERGAMFAQGGPRLFGTLARLGAPTAAIGQAPWISAAAAPCAAGEDPYACDLPRSAAIPAEAQTTHWVRAQLARIPVSGYIDTSHFLCDADVCRAELRGKPVYLDDLHLDPAVTGAFAPEYHDLFT